MSRLVFLVEEPSMAEFLKGFLPVALPEVDFLCIPHQGKKDLEKSIPRKLRAWTEPSDQFVIVRDNDGGDCQKIKTRLRRLCAGSPRKAALIRLACQELEAWYLGGMGALESAFGKPGLARLGGKRKFRSPDKLAKPSQEIRRIIPEFQKVSGARIIGPALAQTAGDNCSKSFQVFVSGVRGYVAGKVVARPRSRKFQK